MSYCTSQWTNVWSNDGRGPGWAMGEFIIAAAARTTKERVDDCMYFSDPYTQPVQGYLEGTPEWKTKWDNQERAPPPYVVHARIRESPSARNAGGRADHGVRPRWLGRRQNAARGDGRRVSELDVDD